MLRTSRKWKNAVRYQAVQAFQPEWKVVTVAQTTPVGLPGAPGGITTDLTSVIAQGLANNQRVGSQIRLRRITLHVLVTCGDCPGLENRGCVQLEIHRWPQRLGTGSTSADARLAYVDTGARGIDWTNGAPRVLGNTAFGADPALGTRDLIHVASRKKFSLQAAPRWYDRGASAAAPGNAYPDHRHSTNGLGGQLNYVDLRRLSTIYTNGGIGAAAFSQMGGTVGGTGTIDLANDYPEIRGPFHKRLVLEIVFGPNGMVVQYPDVSSVVEPRNKLVLRAGSSSMSPNINASAGSFPSYIVFYGRMWYTDA